MTPQSYRIGFGEDAHRLDAGRPLIIGGVKIPDSPHGTAAHSDGDALLHALSDALLSAFALGDIGHYFPPSDPAFKDMESTKILTRVLNLLNEREESPEIVNVAAVVTLDKPKLEPHRTAIAAQVAALLDLPQDRVGLGFKTSEGLAPAHIQTRVTVLLKG